MRAIGRPRNAPAGFRARPRNRGLRIVFTTMNRILRAALSGVVLLLLFSFVPLTSVTAALGGIGAGWLALATVVAALELVTRSVRLGILTAWHRMPLSTAAIVEINLISGFYALFLPGELAGGALRWYRMSRPSGQRAEALAAIGFARLVDTIGLVALGALFFLLDRPPRPPRGAACGSRPPA